MKFVNLHHHTTFSFMDGYGSPAHHVARAAELGYTCITATEHGNVSSFFQLEKAAIKAGIKPIYGMEAYCGSVEADTRSQFKHHLTILARNSDGYRGLNRIVARSYLDHHYHPTVSGDNLADNSEGLTVLSGCSGSLLACSLLGGKGTPEHNDDPSYEDAEDVIWKFRGLLGDNYFLEVQPFYELERTCAMNRGYENLSEITGVPIIVTHDVHYPKMEDHDMQAVLHAVGRGKASVDDAMREWNYKVPLTLPSSDKALVNRLVRTGLSRKTAWNAIEWSQYIGDCCNVTLPKAERLRYPIGEADLAPWEIR